jgi:hypothetical protein
MSKHEKTTELAEAPAERSLAVRPNMEARSIVADFGRLAAIPEVTPEKLNALIDAQVRVMAITAKQAFDRDFAAMQGKMPVIVKSGKATVKKNGEVIRSTQYVRSVDIVRAVRPILAKYGFALRFRHEVKDGLLIVTGILSHKDGHSVEDQFVTPRDDDFGKNVIQTWGSARQYGQRYTTIALLWIASEEDDDDGAATGPVNTDAAPVSRPAPKAAKAPAPPARAPLPTDAKVITDAQRKRLWAIFKNSGRNEEAFKAWLNTRFGYTSTGQITRDTYDAICTAVEAKGPLPLVAREVGEEG